MLFNEFTTTVVARIKDFLPEDFANAFITTESVSKLGIAYEALIVRKGGKSCAPAISLNDAFDEYCITGDLNAVMRNIADIITEADPDRFEGATSILNDYSLAKTKLFVRLSNAERNASVLDNCPHRIIEDLAATYHILISKDSDGVSSTLVTNRLLSNYGISADQLHEDAVRNSKTLLKPNFTTLNELLGLPPLGLGMFVLSNETGVNGASVILYPNVLKRLSETFADDLFILPSSIHEVIVIPASGKNADQLADIVKDVNGHVVDISEQLSDNVYFYNSYTDSWRLADASASPVSPAVTIRKGVVA